MEKNNSIYKTTMTWGLVLGIVMVLFSLVPYLMNIYQTPSWVGWLMYAVMVLGIAYGQIRHRDDDLGGYITYSRSFGAGMLIMLFASIVYAFYFILLTTVIDTEYMAKVMNAATELLYESGMPEEQVDMAMEMSGKLMTPSFMLISSVFSYAFFGAIFSLITSIFVKKEQPMFPEQGGE